MDTTKILLVGACCFGMIAAPVLADNASETRRPDLSVELDVRDEVWSLFRFDRSEIRARVIGGTVSLEGEVSSYGDRIRAERAVERVDGVKNVLNRLTVDPWSSGRDNVTAMKARDKHRLVSSTPNQLIRGIVQFATKDELVVRDFHDGYVEATVDERANVTLDGMPVDRRVLAPGFLVKIDAMQVDGELIAKTVTARSPK